MCSQLYNLRGLNADLSRWLVPPLASPQLTTYKYTLRRIEDRLIPPSADCAMARRMLRR